MKNKVLNLKINKSGVPIPNIDGIRIVKESKSNGMFFSIIDCKNDSLIGFIDSFENKTQKMKFNIYEFNTKSETYDYVYFPTLEKLISHYRKSK